MATITPGNGAIFTSTTAEGQCLEALIYLQGREANSLANPAGEDRINGSFSIDTLVFEGEYRLTANQSITLTGQLSIAVQSYLDGGSFSPGTEGTFKSSTIESYVLEVLMYLQFLEATPGKNPQNRNFVTGNYNADQSTYSGTFSLPVSLTLNGAGGVAIQAVEYLLT